MPQRQLIQNVRTAQVKAIAATSDTCTVKITCGNVFVNWGYENIAFTLRAWTSLVKLTQDIDGTYDLELLRYSETDLALVTDVIVIDSPSATPYE